MKRVFFGLIVIVCLAVFAACGGNNNDNGGDNGDNGTQAAGIEQIAGEFYIDMSPGGMPMTVFLEIMADYTFVLRRPAGDAAGQGTVGGIDGTWMLLYDDDRRATFTVVDGNLVFSTLLPFGTANIGFPEGYDVTAVRMIGGVRPEVVDPSVAMVAGLAGQYHISLADFGMPMTFYLFIEEDGAFRITTTAGDHRESGIVEVRGGGFTLVYDNDDEDRVDFVTNDGNLVFSDRLPIGVARVGSDEEGLYVIAVLLGDDHVTVVGGLPSEAELVGDLVGRYLIDLADFGMPMTFYLYIEADGTFAITTSGGDPRESGTVVVRPGGFTLVYDNDAETRVDFTPANDTLRFLGRVPIGVANVGSDEDGMDVIAVLVGDGHVSAPGGMPGAGADDDEDEDIDETTDEDEDTTAAISPIEQISGTYALSYSFVGAMGPITHDLHLTLNANGTFALEIETTTPMGVGKAEIYGTFTISGNTINFVCSAQAFAGTVTAAGEIVLLAPDVIRGMPTSLESFTLPRE